RRLCPAARTIHGGQLVLAIQGLGSASRVSQAFARGARRCLAMLLGQQGIQNNLVGSASLKQRNPGLCEAACDLQVAAEPPWQSFPNCDAVSSQTASLQSERTTPLLRGPVLCLQLLVAAQLPET